MLSCLGLNRMNRCIPWDLLRYLRRTNLGGPVEYAGQLLGGLIHPGLIHPGLIRSGATPAGLLH
jgi:hypothetical protein